MKSIVIFILILFLISCDNRFKSVNNKNESGIIVNGNKEGLWEFRDDKGNLTESRMYSEGKLNGWTVKYMGKFPYDSTFYLNNKLTGWKRVYSSPSTMSLEKELLNGINHGWFKQYYPNGNLEFETNNKNGVQEGLNATYYKNTNLESFGYLSNSNSKNVMIEFDINGKIGAIEKWDDFSVKEGVLKLEGIRIIFEKNGIPKYIFKIKDGVVIDTLGMFNPMLP